MNAWALHCHAAGLASFKYLKQRFYSNENKRFKGVSLVSKGVR